MLLDLRIHWANFTGQVAEQPTDLAWAIAIAVAAYALIALVLREHARNTSIARSAAALGSLAALTGYISHRFDLDLLPVVVALASLSALAAGLSVASMRRGNATGTIADEIAAMGLDAIQDAVLETRNGEVVIDHAIFVGGAILTIVCRPFRGAVYGNRHSRHWTVVQGRSKVQYPNPLVDLQLKTDAIRDLVGKHTAGIVLVSDKVEFPNGRPNAVFRCSELCRVIDSMLDTPNMSPEGSRAWHRLKTHTSQGRDATRRPMRTMPDITSRREPVL